MVHAFRHISLFYCDLGMHAKCVAVWFKQVSKNALDQCILILIWLGKNRAWENQNGSHEKDPGMHAIGHAKGGKKECMEILCGDVSHNIFGTIRNAVGEKKWSVRNLAYLWHAMHGIVSKFGLPVTALIDELSEFGLPVTVSSSMSCRK